jgi:pantoate kinase
MSFQSKVNDWVIECFSEENLFNKHERSQRFIEEAIELAQASGLSKENVKSLVEYVYDRPIGEFYQEVGGVMVTLAGLCTAFTEDLKDCAKQELRRINNPEVIKKIRYKQSLKPILCYKQEEL